MNLKDYLIAVGLAAAGGIVVMLCLLIATLLGWGVVWGIATIALIPVALKAIRFWRDNDCLDFDDFFTELFKEKRNSSSISDSDW